MTKLNSIGAISAPKAINSMQQKSNVNFTSSLCEAKDDEVVIKSKKAPKIGFFRLATGLLTDEQINQINETGKLPKNAKFVVSPQGGYMVANNFFSIVPGTRDLPAGFEIKKGGILGSAIVVPKGTEGLLIRSAEEN